MAAPSIETVQNWQGRAMVDPAGDKLGTIDAIYLDDETGQPEWALVYTGLFTAKIVFVPLAQAQATRDSVQVPYDKDQVTSAPTMRADGSMSQDDEAKLYRHYGLDYSEHRSDSGLPVGTAGQGIDSRDRDGDGIYDDVQDSAAGRDTSGPTTDQAMTRPEEELRVGTETRERGRARLRKYVTTETQQVTVPVQREEVRVEREPITDANLDEATSGPEHLRGGARGHPARGGGRGREAGRAQGAGAPGHRDRHRGAPGQRGGPQGADRGRGRPGPARPSGPALSRSGLGGRGRRSSSGPSRLPNSMKEQHCDS